MITTVCEHNSVLRPLYRLQEEGVEVSILSADENGVLEYEKLPELVRENTKGIVITHASNLTGNITDLERIREVTESRDLLLVVDGSQTAGILPVDVQKQGIDIFCFTGHKIYISHTLVQHGSVTAQAVILRCPDRSSILKLFKG